MGSALALDVRFPRSIVEAFGRGILTVGPKNIEYTRTENFLPLAGNYEDFPSMTVFGLT